MKKKILPVLLPILCLIFGYTLGATLPKPNFKKTQTETSKQTENNEQVKSEKNVPQNQEAQYETYTVLPGDTLFGISLKFDITMEELASANGITDANQIQAGQVLKIPKAQASSEETKPEIDLEKMKEIQARVDQGEQLWRLDPVEVVKATAPASFEFSATDSYTLKSKDESKGEAVVLVNKTKDSKTNSYEVHLIQPITKGENGIWAINLIKKLT